MNIFYEEDGSFKVGSILSDNTTSLQVESTHGKRSKIKTANVLLRFNQPGLAEFIAQTEELAASIDVEFLWQCCPSDEFSFDVLATEYVGHAPTPIEFAGVLWRLHSSPMYFYKKGKGNYKAAPADALKSALASAEKKRLLVASQARYTEELTTFKLPPEFTEKLAQLLYKPDRNSIETKALEAACTATQLSTAHLLQRCGALPSSQNYHLQRFLFEHFPRGIGFPGIELEALTEPAKLPLAEAAAFSIDDATTTEIDDAFSVRQLANGNWKIGVHIAVPALGITAGSPCDAIAAQRLSTVYMPGDKITMLPDNVVQEFSLNAGRTCPALSMYLEVSADTLAVLNTESRIERILVAANLRLDTLEPLFNEQTLATGKQNYAFASELTLLWNIAQKMEAARGKAAENIAQMDYNFYVINDQVSITTRRRGSPIDKVVSELMIFVNSAWGKLLADHEVAGIYRTQNNGKVKMSTVPSPHQGLGVAQYLWSSSPLRRYVDMVNQRQILTLLLEHTPSYEKNDTALFTIMANFDAAYAVYNEFQRTMERYWCLRWLLQEKVQQVEAWVLRDNTVRLTAIPLMLRIPSLPELPPNSHIMLEIGEVDLLDLHVQTRFISVIEEATA